MIRTWHRSIFLFALLICVACRVVHFSYVGCYVDYTGGVRDLSGLTGVTKLGEFDVNSQPLVHSNSNMSHELCSQICSLGRFAYFGVQDGRQCFCGNSYGSQGNASESTCSHSCSGNPQQKCGGPSRNSVFALSYLKSSICTVMKQKTHTVVTSKTSSWPVEAQSDADCLIQCSARAAVFSQQLLACHLLAFAYPPASLSGPDWTLFIKK